MLIFHFSYGVSLLTSQTIKKQVLNPAPVYTNYPIVPGYFFCFKEMTGLYLYLYSLILRYSRFTNLAASVEEDAHLAKSRQCPCDRIASKEHNHRTMPSK